MQKVEGISEINVDDTPLECSFQVDDTSIDLKKILEDIEKTNSHMENWSVKS